MLSLTGQLVDFDRDVAHITLCNKNRLCYYNYFQNDANYFRNAGNKTRNTCFITCSMNNINSDISINIMIIIPLELLNSI